LLSSLHTALVSGKSLLAPNQLRLTPLHLPQIRYPDTLIRLPGSFFLRNLVERRSLLYQLVRRDFQQRYVGSTAGWLWGLIHPLVLLLSYTFAFQIIMRFELPNGENYTLFLMAGLLPWLLFSETVIRSAGSLVEHSNLITKTLFPSEIIPVSVFCSSLINHFFTFILVVGAILFTGGSLHPGLILLPGFTLLAGLFATGIGWFAASLQVYLRDTSQAAQVSLTLWFWLTPIFINEDQYPENMQFVIDSNPMAYIVRGYRDLLLYSRIPDPEETLVLAFYCLLTFIIGGLFFRQLKRGFADVL